MVALKARLEQLEKHEGDLVKLREGLEGLLQAIPGSIAPPVPIPRATPVPLVRNVPHNIEDCESVAFRVVLEGHIKNHVEAGRMGILDFEEIPAWHF